MTQDDLHLSDDRSRLVIAPGKGGGIVRFEALAPGRQPVALLKAARGGDIGCELLVPWSNRISGGGFTFDGRFHPIEPNVPGDPFPLHGDGFQKFWRAARSTDTEAELILDHGAIGPYRYVAHVTYALRDGTLEATLTVENRAEMRLPYGLGFHPWFLRHAGTSLTAGARRVWLEDERHLPAGVQPIAAHPDWDFSAGARLPAGWINNGFDGWDGAATIVQPEDGIALSMQASPELNLFIVYSPSHEADFFCFEPVSHPVDAHHGEGLVVLEPGEVMSAGMRLGWRLL